MKLLKHEVSVIGNTFDQLNSSLIMIDEKQIVIYINHYAQKLLGIEHDVNVLGQPFSRIIKHCQTPIQLDIRIPSISTAPLQMHEVYKQLKIVAGTLDTKSVYFILDQDVTEQQKMYAMLENTLLEVTGQAPVERFSLQRYVGEINTFMESILNKIPCIVYWKNKNFEYIGCNQTAANFSGLKSTKDVVGKTDFDLFSDIALAESYRAMDKQVIREGKSLLNVQQELVNPAGEKFYTLVSKTPLTNKAGQVIGIVGITIDITKEKQSEIAKNEFIANMSHDIRTPLTGVIGMSEILRDEVENPEHKQDANLLAESGQQLLVMLNEILEDVRADNLSVVDLQQEHFDLYQCITDLIKLESPTTISKHLGLEYRIDPDVPQFIINDRKKIHHILLNLLSNAIKFTQKGHITIHVKCLDRTSTEVLLEFSVADTGIGIPSSLQKKVFERFFRVDPSYKGRYRGYGLGLHIVQTYVHLLGGHITLTSHENSGTTFHFDLRCQIAKEENRQIKPVDIPVIPPSPAAATHSIESASVVSEHAPVILLIEDNRLALKVLETLVTKAGLHFLSVSSGEDALQLVQKHAFDFIISDIGLPGISGNEFTKQLRLFEKTQSIAPTPVIGLTGHAYDSARPECLASGMNALFSKPMTREMLAQIKSQYLKQKTPQINQPLGPDLPDTVEALFLLDNYPLFDPEEGMKYTTNQALLIEMLNCYLSDEIQQDIRHIEKAYLTQNWPEIEHLAHKIKGGAMTIGIVRMRYACQYLERYHKAGHREHLDKLYHQLLAVNHETTLALHAWLLQHSLEG